MLIATAVGANADEKARPGFLDFNGYYDTRDLSVMTLNILADLPARFQYFSLTNYSNSASADQPEDLDTFYTEQNLRWTPREEIPLDLSTQWVTRSGPDNDIARLGVRWRPASTPVVQEWFDAIGLNYFVILHLVQFDQLPSDGTRMQIEHAYRWPVFPSLLDGRVYLGGFIDHNMWFNPPRGIDTNTVVTEHQLGVRLLGELYAVAEFRRNEFFLSRKNGVGFGLEYRVPFTLRDSAR